MSGMSRWPPKWVENVGLVLTMLALAGFFFFPLMFVAGVALFLLMVGVMVATVVRSALGRD